MQKVLSADIWNEIGKRARTADSRKAAIAYFTKDLVGFRAGDVLVVDASRHAIRTGQTDARLLQKLNRAGVRLYSQEGLHAKVLLLDGYSIVGSANMSSSSARLIEAAVISDNATIASGVSSFIAQLATPRHRLDSTRIAALCKIKVVRQGWPQGGNGNKSRRQIRKLGDRTWIIGVKELARDPTTEEQNHIDRAHILLNERLNEANQEYDWIRWGKLSTFSKECREGDTLIRIFNQRNGRRYVTCGIPVLLKRFEPKWLRFYLGDKSRKQDQVSWRDFQKVLREIGYPRRVRPFSVQLLEPTTADELQKQWKIEVRARNRRSKP
jgi:hypothetical protein